MVDVRFLASILAAVALAGCGGSGGDSTTATQLGSLSDTDSAADAVSESARAGAAVGITVTAPELAARGAVTFALTDSSSGSFRIDATSGVIVVVGGLDYEAAARRTLTARATSSDGQYFAEANFAIDITDSPAPALQIDFPFTHANYAYSMAGVSGRVIHPDPSSLNVRASAGSTTAEGVVTADGRFFVRDVAVTGGDLMTLTVTAAHAGNESATASISLGRAPDLSMVESLIVDGARDRYLLADRYSGTIVAVARNGYARSVLTGAGKGSGAPLEEPVDLALDAENDRLYVLDDSLDAVIRVDPISGDRTVVSSGSVIGPGVGTGTSLLTPTALVFDSTRRTLFVVDDGRNALVVIDPATGNRTTISDNNPAYGATMNFWGRIALESARNRAITASGSVDDLYGVDLTTGVRSLVSDSARDIPNANRSFSDIAIAPARGAAYLADDFSNAVVRMDLVTGARTSISSSGLAGALTHPVIGTGPELEWPTSVLYDETQDRLFVFEEGFADPLIEIDEATGNRTLVTNGAVGAGINFKGPAGITLHPSGRIAYVVDYVADIAVAVNLDDGARRLIAGSPTGRGTIATSPIGVDVDSAASEIYVVDPTVNSLYALDILTGAQRTIADQVTGTGPLLDNPVDVAVDPLARVAYVLDNGVVDALFAVDLATGNRRSVAQGFAHPLSLAIDPAGSAYIATDADEIVRVDLASGQYAVVSGTGPRPGHLGGLAFDAEHRRLLALDLYPNRVLAIDLATGTRSVVSGPQQLNGGTDVGGGPSLERPAAIHVDTTRQIAYLTDDAYDAVIAVDLSSGYRQVVAR